MKTKQQQKRFFIILGIVLFLTAAVILAYKIAEWSMQEKRAQSASPVVQIINPGPDEIFPFGTKTLVLASASSPADIQILELWLEK